ncbi:putative myo-inositol-1(or 4)-monophosphatase protein [Phaeoacremonium minimum UCRPA7]|uniref:Putative myo-inositol-1(Or 4)-monophosphatase protein n=1 Tax=Phaeoacremonium minimum (strain UCR-PA7) TaxID=1286976 RepID=R8BAP5_PHAM7|nr:putative myo-inositol-1(or 4)-monophosphatase protein [Phaeoacremonium minimum UCRPA7]EON96364.1 putative myo-inositol-1(or 4)-monophosphatase protein [Phaeoacremonium minimum UCRPA7]
MVPSVSTGKAGHNAMAPAFQRERRIAELAVQRAIIATERVRNTMTDKGMSSKADHSPVSIGDFAGQALLISALHGAFPEDRIIAEETADALRSDEALKQKVWDVVSSTRLEDKNVEGRLRSPTSPEDMLALIDLGSVNGDSSRGRVWTIDPIDGTKTYLEDGQYTVVAALIEDGVQLVGVVGCPHLSLDSAFGLSDYDHVDPNTPGYIVSAVRGYGSQLRVITKGDLSESVTPISRLSQEPTLSRFLVAENSRSVRPSIPDRHRIADVLGVPWQPVQIYSTQLRYVACALGRCDGMWRLPADKNDHTYIWDHNGGILIFKQVGGRVLDLQGRKMDLSAGRRLDKNICTIAMREGIRERVVKAVRVVARQHEQYAFLPMDN